MKFKFSLLLILFLFIFNSISIIVTATNTNVLYLEMNDTIDQSSVEILNEGIEEAKLLNSEAILLILNTPGGGLKQTFEIADIIRDSNIPIIGYVYPVGAAAWSAGTFILISSHIAAMANHTIIGSCQPVEVTFEGTKVINDSKTINALVEWIQERANIYGRNKTIVKEFVTINKNINASFAQEIGCIEFVADSIENLLIDIDGFTIIISENFIELNTKDAKIIRYSPSLRIQFLKIISNPALTSLLLMLGIFALIFGISSPGFGAEVFGVIAILISLIGSGFAISEISIIFIITGCLLLTIEIFATPGFGVIGIGGIICLIFGSIFLIPTFSTREWVISMDWINNLMIILIVSAVLIAIFFGFLLFKVLEIRKKKKAVGIFIGEEALSIDRLTSFKIGYVLFKGEYWQAKSKSDTIEPNNKVIILEKHDSVLIVKQN